MRFNYDMRKQSFSLILLLLALVLKTKAEVNITSTSVNRQGEEARIINGTAANWTDGTRHQVSVRFRARDKIRFGAGHLCGGSLITPEVVLTAGHCVWDAFHETYRSASEFVVAMGNLDRMIKDNNTLEFNVTQIIVRPDFNISTFVGDIALLFLDGQVPTNFTHAFPIELNQLRNLSDGLMCQVSGWGRTEKNASSAKLMLVDVPLINNTMCSTSYGSFLQDGMICAGYMAGERDACAGDSGGPLVCGSELVGVVSFGVGCAEPGYPGVYAEVASYADWIQNEVRQSNIEKPENGVGNEGPMSDGGPVTSIPSVMLSTFIYLLWIYIGF